MGDGGQGQVKGSQAKTISPNGPPLWMVLAKKESWGLKRWAYLPQRLPKTAKGSTHRKEGKGKSSRLTAVSEPLTRQVSRQRELLYVPSGCAIQR